MYFVYVSNIATAWVQSGYLSAHGTSSQLVERNGTVIPTTYYISGGDKNYKRRV